MKLVLPILALLAITAFAYAHSGGLDALGCHNDKKRTEYHCHRGQLAGERFQSKAVAIQKMNNQPTYNKVQSTIPYSRSLYRHWVDADGDCQNTRQEVLIQESLQPVKLDGRGCKVIAGRWYDPYTDQTFSDPAKLDIDHLVPLAEVHRSGGDKWGSQHRSDYANDLSDPRSLIAVMASANRTKSDKDPANWLPPNLKYRCDYIEAWIGVKKRWSLKMDATEMVVVQSIVADCL